MTFAKKAISEKLMPRKIQEKVSMRLPPSCATTAVSNLEIIELGFELFDGTVGQLKVLVQPVPLCDELNGDCQLTES